MFKSKKSMQDTTALLPITGNYTQEDIDRNKSVFLRIKEDGLWFHFNGLEKADTGDYSAKWSISGFVEDKNARERYFFIRLYDGGSEMRAMCSCLGSRIMRSSDSIGICEHAGLLRDAYAEHKEEAYRASLSAKGIKLDEKTRSSWY